MEKLKISIITITYNSEDTVRETFDSVRRQNYDNLEYIVIDGGSTDNTLKIANEYNDIITKIVSEKDEGISDAMNKGIRLASGELIGIIHSDDALVDNALNILNDNWDAKFDVFYGDAIITDISGQPKHILCSSEDLSQMPYGFCIVHPSTFVTKKAYEKFGYFDKKYKCAMDYELLLRFYKANANFKYINKNLAYYREGGTNMKMRRCTINEVCEISILYGGSRLKANMIRIKKILVDKVRPIIKVLNLKNKRVKSI